MLTRPTIGSMSTELDYVNIVRCVYVISTFTKICVVGMLLEGEL